MKNKNSQLLDILSVCTINCYNCFVKCLEDKDMPKMSACIKASVDCAQICQLTSVLISQGSKYAKNFIKICIENCKKCHEICSKHSMDHCQQCADTCHTCALACSAF